jgi:hypothetical protein
MSRTLARVIGALAGTLLVAASASSCVENNASLLIIGVLAPPVTVQAGSACVYTSTITGPYLSNGTMDVAFEEEYVPVLLLGNQLVPRGDQANYRIETNAITIQGAIVRVTDSGGSELDNYTVPGIAFLEPSSGGTPGLSTFSTTLVSPKAADAVRQSLGNTFGTKRLISYVKVFGITTGGTHIESGEVGIPVNACNGCLVTFPAGSDDPAAATQPNCLATSTGSSSIATPCVFGQDQSIDCRLCQGNVACDPSLR